MNNVKFSDFSLKIHRQIWITKRDENSTTESRRYSHSKLKIEVVCAENELHLHIQMELKVLNCPDFDRIKPTKLMLTTNDKELNLPLC